MRWPGTGSKDKFDHKEAGFRLEGRHAQLRCSECHATKYLDAQDRAVLKRANLATTFTGLTSRCSSCHKDVHAGQFAGGCLDCHSQSSWKNPPNFSHAKAAFPLTGKHAEIACADCHKPKDEATGSPVQYKNFVEFDSCFGCHRDPHSGSFGAACERCHSTTNWKQMTSGSQFDHSRTRFPLLGAHIDVSCQSCHKPGQANGTLQFASCTGCHADPHKGQFSSATESGNCTACHDENSWKQTKYSVADHAQTPYPLLGKHAAVACDACHTSNHTAQGDETQFKLKFAACTDCHKDAHTGQFADAPYQNRCDSCHDLNGFQPSTFDLRAHAKTAFGLTGAHEAVPCSGCHLPAKEETRYHVASEHCADCHKTPHGSIAAVYTCEGCHKTTNWQKTAWFDHSTTKFPLEGRHASVACLGCHKPGDGPVGVRAVEFTTSQQCDTCHEDIHQGQFRSTPDRVICGECHTANDWRPTRFDHNQHSTFRLDGAHENVPCRMCHERHEVAGKLVITYKGTPRECADCHK